MEFEIDGETYLDRESVEKLTNLKQSLMYEKMRYDRFPKPHTKLMQIVFTRKRKLWRKSEIDEYLESTRQSSVESTSTSDKV